MNCGMHEHSEQSCRHSQFYLDTVVYEVDHTLFRVPSRYFHENSDIFGTAAQISTSTEGLGAGSSEDPVSLPTLPYDVNADDFALLVRVVIALTADLPLPSNYTLNDWVSVLKLSTFWGFSEIRSMAKKRLCNDDLTSTIEALFSVLDFFANRDEFSDVHAMLLSHVRRLVSDDEATMENCLSVLKYSADRIEYADLRNAAISRVSSSSYSNAAWIQVLEFSDKRIDFSDLRDIAISRLSTQMRYDFVKQVKLGQQYQVDIWVTGGLEGLANTSSMPPMDELEGLGVRTAFRLLYLRDSHRNRKKRFSSYDIKDHFPDLVS
ncbi:hypothetical protein L218DRAFT_953960 [Marasmius fiardii PR-910]|nr:hypothetical protein L218DRAFT_953960 [Marasmius fiardii PR-910]